MENSLWYMNKNTCKIYGLINGNVFMQKSSKFEFENSEDVIRSGKMDYLQKYAFRITYPSCSSLFIRIMLSALKGSSECTEIFRL